MATCNKLIKRIDREYINLSYGSKITNRHQFTKYLNDIEASLSILAFGGSMKDIRNLGKTISIVSSMKFPELDAED